MFQYEKHKKLWKMLKSSWIIVSELGFLDYKEYLVNQLSPNEDIYHHCYACDSASQLSTAPTQRCRYCPIQIGNCYETNSIFNRILDAIKQKDKDTYVRMCTLIMNAPLSKNGWQN